MPAGAVLPAAIGANRIARLITRPSAERLLTNAGDNETLNEDLDQVDLKISEFRVAMNTVLVGRSRAKLSLGEENQFVVIAIRHASDAVTRNPDPQRAIQANDTLIVLAHHSALPQLKRQVASFEFMYRGARG
jgi:voltage-gated potassium channel